MTKHQLLSTLIEGTSTTNRRHFIAASGMAALFGRSVVAQSETASPEASPDSTPDTEVADSHLMVGIAGFSYTDELYSEVDIYDSDLEMTGSVEVPDGVLSVEPTGNPNIAMVNTMVESILFQMDTGSAVEIDWKEERSASEFPQWIHASLGGVGSPRNPEWIVGSNSELTEVLTVNTRTLVGRVITPYVNQTEQSIIPVLPRYNPNGSLMGLWTGDNVYLVDLEHPEEARRLYGDHPEWYSTTIDIDPTATWCTYTVYDPNSEDASGEVLLENVSSREFLVLTEGSAWSQAQFIPGNPDEFILIANGNVEVRRVDDPQSAGEHLAEIGEQTHGDQIWDSTGTRFVLGTRESDDAPEHWLLIDIPQRSVTELPDLEGLTPMMPAVAMPSIDHILFGLQEDGQAGPAIGFSFGSREAKEYLTDLLLGNAWTYSASADGRWYYLETENRGETRGAWLIDLDQGDVHDLPWGDGEYTIGGAISSQGDKAAISVVTRPSDEHSTYIVEPGQPDEREPVGDGVVLGWI